MTRDGLIEVNETKETAERVSRREREADFSRPQEQPEPDMPQKKRQGLKPAAQEQPEVQQAKESPAPDSTQAGSADTAPEPAQEQAFIPPYQTFTCPHKGAQITEDDCYDCKHRTGCPAHDDAPAADA